MESTAQVARQVRLVSHPQGRLRSSDFTIADAPLPPPGAHQALVRNRWFRISVSTRLMASRDAKAIKGIPFPPLRPGDALADAALGEVLAAGAESGLRVGQTVLHRLGWRDHALVDARQCRPLPAQAVDPAAYLGHGWTAYAALTRGVELQRGDTVFISSGAGAIGSMAGQIARRLGAGRIIGSTGSADKAEWMKRELGYDAVIVRDAQPFATHLSRAAPDGIDVCVDLVGGGQLGAAVGLAREGARFVILGALTAELHAERSSAIAPAEIDTFAFPIKGITLRGYSACEDDADAFAEWLRCLDAWQRDGGMRLPCTIVHGLDNGPAALQDACDGKLKGVVLVGL
jgi:NADPH-dependent curcumin reductase CurA